MSNGTHDNIRVAAWMARGLAMLLLLGAGVLRAAPADASEPPADTNAVAGVTNAVSGQDLAEQLMNAKLKKLGARFIGLDPAFLVLPRPTERSRMAAELLTPEVKEMIEGSMRFLVVAQDPDGGWSDKEFPANTGVTALSCLAFMGNGSTPRIGPYGTQLARGAEFLLKNAQPNGVIAGKGSNKFGPMYEHMYSTLAMLLMFGDLPWEPQSRRTIERAIEVLRKSQKLDGGWRYAYSSEGQSDASLTATALWVLRTAKKSGFTVDPVSVKRGVRYIEQCAMPDGTFRYRYWGLHANPSLGGTGIIALSSQGQLDHMLIPPSRDRIDYDYQRYTVKDFLERDYFMYGCFYAGLATYACGDEHFLPCYKKIVQILKASRRKDGEFADQRDNTVYVTAMAAITLQAPYGYLPIYER